MRTFNKSYSNLTSIPLEVFQLTELEKLFLLNNELTEIPNNIGQLVNLEELRLNDNKLTHLPPEIGQLKQLRSLYLSNNKLTTLPPEIGLLENLTALHLAGNQINELPKEIGGLSKLRELSLNGNQLHFLPSEIGKLTDLEHFSISRNSFSFLPVGVGKLSKIKRFNYNENSFPTPPPEIMDKGPIGILNYFGSLEEDKQALNEVKVLLVGEGGAGKTSLVKRLLGEEFDKYEPQTHGININNWYVHSETQEIKVNIWDFGGQEIMHATHQFFLSRRSLYILVLDSRKNEKAEYWLKHIESFGGDSPIIVVLNKIDENPSFNLNERFLKKKYEGIKGIYRISCAEDIGIKALSESLVRELAQVKMIKTTWAKSWFAVKNHLENLEGHYISYEQYRKLCLQCGISIQSNQSTLVDFLHDIGVVIHFREFDLEDVHVLEPQWITEAVYKIINSRELAVNRGLLMLQDLSVILEASSDNEYSYPLDKYGYIISLMKKFELCYELNPETILVPDLLDVQEPTFRFNYEDSLKFILNYEFLPRSVIPRFIVKTHKDIKDNLKWRTGVVLEDNGFNSTAVVKADYEAKKIELYVNGEQQKDYFSTLLYFFREIHNDFEKFSVEERIPIPNEPDVTTSYEHLLTLSRKDIDEFIPDGSQAVYNVKELLGIIQIRKKGAEAEQETLRILRKLEEKITDESSVGDTLNKIIAVKPNVFGIGVDFNKIAKMFLDRHQRNQ